MTKSAKEHHHHYQHAKDVYPTHFCDGFTNHFLAPPNDICDYHHSSVTFHDFLELTKFHKNENIFSSRTPLGQWDDAQTNTKDTYILKRVPIPIHLWRITPLEDWLKDGKHYLQICSNLVDNCRLFLAILPCTYPLFKTSLKGYLCNCTLKTLLYKQGTPSEEHAIFMQILKPSYLESSHFMQKARG